MRLLRDTRMTTEERMRGASGWVGAAVGVVAVMAATAVGIISFTPADPPTWIRIGVFWLLMLAIPAAVLLGVTARRGRSQVWGWAGAGLGVLSLAAFVTMMIIGE